MQVKEPNTVKIAGNNYVLAMSGDSPAFASGQRAIQGAPTDDFHLPINLGGRGVGRSFLYAQNMTTSIPGVLLPMPKQGTFALGSIVTAPLKDSFEEQDANGRWYKYLWGPRSIVKVDITSNPPVVRQVYDLTVPTVAAFATTDRLGRPVLLTSAGTNYWYWPANSGDRVVKMTTPVSDETASTAYSPVVTLAADITTANGTTFTYTSTGDPIAAGDVVIIDTERIRVGAVNTATNTCSACVRGWSGTTAATHTATTAVTHVVGDTFAAITSIVKGAAHFEAVPDGRVERANSSHTTGTAQNRAEVSLLTAGAAPDTDANWGSDWPVSNQTRWITGLLSYGESVLIHKQDGWYAATALANGSVSFQTILPDENYVELVAQNAETTYRGTVWDGYAFLPSGSLKRSSISSQMSVDPDSILGNETTDVKEIADAIRFGRIPHVAAIGDWIYGIYPTSFNASAYLMAATRNAEKTLDWHPLYFTGVTLGTPFNGCQLVTVQVNGVGAPRVFYAFDANIKYFSVGKDGHPALLDGYASWDSQLAGSWYSNDIQFECNVLLREFEYIIEDTNSNFRWGLSIYRNGGIEQQVLAIGAGLTTTGSIFLNGVNDQCRRLRIQVNNNGAALNNTTDPPTLRGVILHGTYLPDVSDELTFVVDTKATAELRKTSQKAIYDELRALTSAGAKAWIDLYAQSGYIAVRNTKEGGPTNLKALQGRPYVTVNATLVEYS